MLFAIMQFKILIVEHFKNRIMTKSKVGAEPKGRVKHSFTKDAGIGCHILWFDDIKDFARYYNLQDKLSFPLDRTTEECMENHLIHLHSGRTIKAVGMTDI